MTAGRLVGEGPRGAPLQGLWASETTIYGRFGYGIAAESDEVSLPAAPAVTIAARGGADDVDFLDDPEASPEASEVLAPVYDRVHRSRPGTYARDAVWWRWRRFRERPDLRKGASKKRWVVEAVWMNW